MAGIGFISSVKVKKKVLIVYFGNHANAPRISRTIKALVNDFEVHVFSTGINNDSKISFTSINNLIDDFKAPSFHLKWPALVRKPINLLVKLFIEKKFSTDSYFKKKYWSKGRKQIVEMVNALNPDLIIGHGIYTLPILTENQTKAKRIFNAHEYYLKEFEEMPTWVKYTRPFYEFLAKECLHKVDLMFCVCETIQQEYQKHFKIKSVVITNATDYKNISPIKTTEEIKIIHHGAALRTRQIELMAEMMKYLKGNFHLYLMLVPTDKLYFEELKHNYSNNPNIHFIDPVDFELIPEACNKYDIGLFILPPVNFNWLNALPNKLFEFIQGRLCVAVSPNPEMKSLVEKFDLGIVANDYSPESMALKIQTLAKTDIDKFKENAHRHATTLSGEENQNKMREEIKKLLNN
jgi:glycosyltransferase involved in cell wall biosynthesis